MLNVQSTDYPRPVFLVDGLRRLMSRYPVGVGEFRALYADYQRYAEYFAFVGKLFYFIPRTFPRLRERRYVFADKRGVLRRRLEHHFAV